MKGAVKDYMVKQIDTIDDEEDIFLAAEKMSLNPRCYLIVLDRDSPVGIITDQDLVNKVLAKRLDPAKTKVKDVMSSPLITIDPDAPLTEAADIMKKANVRKLPVAKDGILYGIITARDITDEFTDYVDKSIRDVLRYIPIYG
jgi:CBS domain-containing protein